MRNSQALRASLVDGEPPELHIGHEPIDKDAIHHDQHGDVADVDNGLGHVQAPVSELLGDGEQCDLWHGIIIDPGDLVEAVVFLLVGLAVRGEHCTLVQAALG